MLGKKSGASALFSFYCAALQSCPALALQGKSPPLAVVSPYGAPMPRVGHTPQESPLRVKTIQRFHLVPHIGRLTILGTFAPISRVCVPAGAGTCSK